MIDATAARAELENVLRASGFQGGRSVWRLTGSEVQWIVRIEKLPHGNRLGVDIGLDLQTRSMSHRPTDCPILLHLENLPVASDFAVSMALDLDSDLDSDQRRQELQSAAQALCEYLVERVNLAAIRGAYRSGDFDSAFIHKDARAVLEAAG